MFCLFFNFWFSVHIIELYYNINARVRACACACACVTYNFNFLALLYCILFILILKINYKKSIIIKKLYNNYNGAIINDNSIINYK